MQISKEQKELLEDFIAWCEGNTTNALRQGIELAIENYTKFSNSLALGKPEPLRKNKQTEEVCEWVNIYEDENGRFLSDESYESHNEAYHSRDDIVTYIDTVKIVSEHGFSKPSGCDL